MSRNRHPLAVPSAAALQDSLRLPASSPAVQKALGKLSRPALINLALSWIDSSNAVLCAPLLGSETEEDQNEDGLYALESSLEEVRARYEEFLDRKGPKTDVVDRILEGDWRNGITLYQLAVVDVHYLLDHPTSQRWAALKLKLTHGEESDNKNSFEADFERLPRCHGPTFVRNLQREVSNLIKAHYHFTRHRDPAVSVLRIQLYDFPYTSQTSSQIGSYHSEIDSDPVKTIYVAFPDSSSSVFVSLATSTSRSAPNEGQKLRRIILEALPKALSKPKERYSLETTALTARSLSALLALQGGGRENSAAGGWSIFALGTVEESPLQMVVPELKKEMQASRERLEKENRPPVITHRDLQLDRRKRQKLTAEGRFGGSAIEGDGKGLERFDVRMEERFPENEQSGSNLQLRNTRPKSEGQGKLKANDAFALLNELAESSDEESSEAWRPDIRLAFNGTHVFAGIRKMVELGIIDGSRMPGWMTGEAGVSVAAVKHGRVRGK